MALKKFTIAEADMRGYLVLILLTLLPLFCMAQDNELNPGVERWPIKTSLPNNSTKKTIPINTLLKMKNPISKYTDSFDSVRIKKKVNLGLKEGDIVKTTGWLHLVALENDSKNHRDGDFHIQITNSSVWGDSCLVIEVPFPGERFITDPELIKSSKKVRDFIKTKMLKGKEPGTYGNKMIHPCYVTITGQLFFDGVHLKGNPRGKRGMKSYTCWEIHPITSIEFAKKP